MTDNQLKSEKNQDLAKCQSVQPKAAPVQVMAGKSGL